MTENEISKETVDSSIEVHRTLGGPGLLESVYEEALCHELELRGLKIGRQVEVPIVYKERRIGHPLKLDILVENKVIVECKATIKYNSIFESQLLTYLRLTGKKLGLVLNFGEKLMKSGIHRVVNNL